MKIFLKFLDSRWMPQALLLGLIILYLTLLSNITGVSASAHSYDALDGLIWIFQRLFLISLALLLAACIRAFVRKRWIVGTWHLLNFCVLGFIAIRMTLSFLSQG